MSTPSVPKFPQLDCSLFFHELINFHMQNNPTLPMFAYAGDQGITEIPFLEFGRAAHRVAHALRPERTGGHDGQVVILIANSDTILHHVVVAGMSIAGLVPFPVSPRNTPGAVIDMMKKTNCSRIVTLLHAHQSLIDGVREQGFGLAFTVDEMPTLSYAFPNIGREVEADPFDPYPQSVSRPDPDSPSMYIHSSGSTGSPKPIPQSHRFQTHRMIYGKADLRNLSPSDRIGVMALPPFHAYGVLIQLYTPLACLVTAVVYPPQAITDQRAPPIVPTSDNILDSVRRTHCKVVVTVPIFLEQWAASAEAIETLRKLDQIIYGGGPLVDKIGNALWAAGVNICVSYGGTEFGSPVRIREKAETENGEWVWLRFSEDVQLRWMPQGDDTYECQILTTENYQLAIENLPDAKGYATSDLFIKHPTKDLWKLVGRVDDVITLASGEKTVPAPIECIIMSSPLLQGVVMFGRERNQVGVLVEPRPGYAVDVLDINAVSAFRNEIWPFVEEANKIAPTFSRIFKEMILIVDPEQPMIRTPKGTVQRKATIKSYETKIDSLYSDVEATYQSSSGSTGPFTWATEDVLTWLATYASIISKGRSVDPSTDLFAQGFDSLSATYLRNQIVNALRKAPDAQIQNSVLLVSPNIIFEYPTLQLLAARIVSLVYKRGVFQSSDPNRRHVAAMNAMIDQYSVGLSGSAPSPVVNGITNAEVSCSASAVVLLTGSTGGLGSFLLSQLLEKQMVEKVYALNRPSSPTSIEGRQESAFVDKGISVDLLNSGKLLYIETDASRDNCGLSLELYDEIRNSVTIIIHNAWRLDFNLSLVSFEPNIKATRNLVDLALDCKHRSSLRFVFTSSVATVQSWDRTRGDVPEELQLDPSTAVGSGYGESKYVCERIIAKSGLHATSLRIGQIAGGSNGSWATSDWVPIIVKSSIVLGLLPNSLGVVSWMRSEDVAASVLGVAFADSAPKSLNIVNLQRPRWSDIMSYIRDAILEEKSFRLTIVPFVEWVARLEKKANGASSKDLVHIPAIKLLEFFRAMAANDEELAQMQGNGSGFEVGGVAELCTTNAQCVSDAVLKMQPVGKTEAHAWVRYWISKGLF